MTNATTIEERKPREPTPGQALKRRMRQHRGLKIGAAIVLTLLVIAIAAPLIAPHDPFEQSLQNRLLPPIWDARGSYDYLLGTDHLGRDYLSRLIYGARISLTIGFCAAAIGCTIGVTLGICAAYFGGRVDAAINYLLTCQLSLPSLLLAMALVFLIGPSLVVVICVIGFLHWNYFLVVSRTVTLQIKELDYVNAAQALGYSNTQVITQEILPNLLNQIIVIFTIEIGYAIIAEASLSFLGVGVPAPNPSWGLMIAEGKNSMFIRPWLVVLPGMVLFLLVIGINLMGDGLRDVTAPDSRKG